MQININRQLERATPIQGLCHGFFTDQFIFKHILGHFSRDNRISTMSMSALEVQVDTRYQKGKLNLLKGKKYHF